MATLTIKDESGSGRITASITLETGAERITLRDLITTRVREEVARYNARRADPGAGDIFAGLVMPEGAVPTPAGFRVPSRRAVDWEGQAAESLKAFRRNGFFVLVGDRQVTDLDEELELAADSDIRFIRLVALVGGLAGERDDGRRGSPVRGRRAGLPHDGDGEVGAGAYRGNRFPCPRAP